MTNKNSILNLLQFDLSEIPPESLDQFYWSIDGNSEGLFKRFYEQIEAYTFMDDNSVTPLYFGHFEFFEPKKGNLEIVDGKQRLISILAILNNIFSKLKAQTKLEESLALIDEKISHYFSIKGSNQTSLNKVDEFLKKEFEYKAPEFLIRLFSIIENATFSQRITTDKEQKLQVQSNLIRFNSTPSNLRKFEAFCYNSALIVEEEHREWVLNRFKTGFKYVYARFQDVKFTISENDLFEIAARCQDNSLLNGVVEQNLEWFEKHGNFIFKYEFLDELVKTVSALYEFCNHGPNTSFVIHEYLNFNYYKTTLPIIVKAYINKVSKEEIKSLSSALLKIAFRHELIGTCNNLGLKLFPHFLPTKNYSNSINGLLETIKEMSLGKGSPFMSHWNNDNFRKALDSSIFQGHQKFILWIYENALRKEKNLKPLYYDELTQFDVINISEVERFSDEMNTLGNLLLIHKEQQNLPIKEFFKSLSLLTQQKEVVELMTGENIWSREMLLQRHENVKGIIYCKFK